VRRKLGEPLGQFVHEVVLKPNEIDLLDGSRDCERRTLPDSGTLVDSAKRDWLIQLLILRLDQPARVLPGLATERIRRRPRSCADIACRSQRAIAVVENNITFANVIHCVPVVLRAAQLVQHWRPKKPPSRSFV
jgi:hypothetical protein